MNIAAGDQIYVDMCFFFQAEDGIRDLTVTGVQTCALPISEGRQPRALPAAGVAELPHLRSAQAVLAAVQAEHARGLQADREAEHRHALRLARQEIGRASCRERVEISVDARR